MSEHDPMNPSAMDLLQPEFLKLAERICTATPGADRVTLYLNAPCARSRAWRSATPPWR